MGAPATRVRWCVLLGLVLFANLPNLLPWERSLYPATYGIDLQERWLQCLPLTLMAFSLFQRLYRTWLILWLTCVWWMPVSMAVRIFNETPISSALIGIAMESSPGEMTEFLALVPSTFWWLFLGLNAAAFFIYRALRRSATWAFSVRERLWIATPGVMVLMWLAPFGYQDAPVATRESVSAPSDAFDALGNTGFVPSRWTLTFPYELAWAVAEHRDAQTVVSETINQMKESSHAIRPRSQSKMPDLVILVIGESSSRQDWRLFNAQSADTTPRLSARRARDPGLLLQTNVVAQSTATRYAVPRMLTDEPLFWPDGKGNPNATRSVLSIARNAGYRTGWYSNQTAGGKHDGPLAVYAKEADSIAFVNPSSYLQQGTYDEALLPLLDQHLGTKNKAFLVLHTLGSHFKFSHRYPPEFERFVPAESRQYRSPGSATQAQEAVANAYRNSVLYTDHLLEVVISKLEATQRSAVLLYVSDHGQGLSEPGCDKQVMNRSMARAYEVPSLVWLSPRYRQEHPASLELLKNHESAAFTTADVFPALLDLIEGDVVGNEREGGFVRGPMPHTPQMVVSPQMQWIDFPAASLRNRCAIAAPPR